MKLRDELGQHEGALNEAREEQAKARSEVMKKEKAIKKQEKAVEEKVCFECKPRCGSYPLCIETCLGRY